MIKKLTLAIILSSLVFSPLILFPKPTQAQGLGSLISNELTNLGLFTSATQSAASTADAQRSTTVPVFDIVQYAQIRSVEQAKAAKDTKSNILQALYTTFLAMLKKRLLDMLVDQIITWIQGGGKPQFVTDWQKFISDAAGAAVGDVVLQTNSAFLCAPFKYQIQLSLLPVKKFSQRIACTLDDIVANIEDFYNDFTNGGWIAYNELWQPQNNYYGTMLMVHDEALIKAAAAQQAAQDEALAGKGFLPVKRCKGGGIANATPQDIDVMDLRKDYEGNYCQEKDLETITPGNVVGEMAVKAVGSDIDYILSAQELEQYVAAIANAVINRVIKEGVGVIKGSSEQDTSGYTTQPSEDALTNIQEQEKERIISEYQMVIDDRNAVLANKNQAASSTMQLVVILKKLQAADCAPPVSSVEIANAEAEANRLQTEVGNLQKLIIEIQTLKADAEKISPDYRLREMALLTQKYNDFTTKYSSVLTEVYSGSAKADSQQEAQKKQAELSNAKTRLTNCDASL